MKFNIKATDSEIFAVENKNVKKNLKHAESILNGKLVLQSGLDEINIDAKIDWNYEHKVSANTYKLYLHTLNFIKFLTLGYIETKNEEYINRANRYLTSWIEDNYHSMNNSEKVWYDHTVSSRVQNIIYFQINAPIDYKIDSELFDEIIQYHLDFLMDPENYKESNHGIMVDRSIIKVSLLIDDEKEKEKYVSFAKSRVEKAILRDYSYLNMHLENSPSYHRMVTNWLLGITDLLDKAGSPLKQKYFDKLNKAEQLNGVLINYNGEFPMIGDTSYVKTNIKKISEDFADYEAGIVVLNHEPTESTLVFNNGFQNNGHKHFDDLSFVLSVRSEQIFIDSGKYNHSRKDSIRKHLISPAAHNTLSVKNKSYQLADKDKIKLSTYLNFGKFKYISGVHEAYENTRIKRVIVSFDGVNTIIIDKIKSSEINGYVQNFILNKDITISKANENEYKIMTPNSYEYKLESHVEKTISKTYFGKRDNAFISEKFSQTLDTNKIEFNQKSKKTVFITSFLEKDSNIKDIKHNDTVIKFRLDGALYSIPIY